MDVQVSVKDIRYAFSDDEILREVRDFASKTVEKLFLDEQDNYKAALEAKDVENQEEYEDAVGFDYLASADYDKSFAENINLSEVQQEIRKYCNDYMRNVMDLPKDAIVTIDDNDIVKGVADEAVVRAALKEKYGVTVTEYNSAGKAQKDDFLTDKEYTEVGKMMESKDYLTYLNLCESLGKYSTNNISMIYAQNPNVKAVMGLKAWNEYDRWVNSGQHPIYIWTPKNREFKTESQIDSYITRKYGKHADEKEAIKEKEKLKQELEKHGVAEVLSGWRLGGVFDIGQTHCGDPEHDLCQIFIDRDKPLKASLDNFQAVRDALMEASMISSTDAERYKIRVPSVVENDQQQEVLFNSVKEYADKVLTEIPSQVKKIKSAVPHEGDMHKIESIVAAHLICKHLGIDCDDKVHIQLATLLGDKFSEQSMTKGRRQMFTEATDHAYKLFAQVTRTFDKAMGLDLSAEKEDLKEAAKQLIEQRKAEAEKRKNEPKAPPPRREVDAQNENHVFYRSKKGIKWGATVQDEWRSQNVDYLLLQIDKDGKYMVDLTCNGNQAFLKNEEGKAATFENIPERREIENLAKKQLGNEVQKNKPFERVG